MPIFWQNKVLLAKIETTYGTDSVPTGGANAILAVDVKLSPMEGSDVSRDLDLPYLAAQATIPANLHQKLSFKVELRPSGTAGTAPAWGVLMRGCAMAQTVAAGVSVTYNPVSAGHEALTFHLSIGGTRYVLTGARGTAKIVMAPQAIPYLEFEFTGLFNVASDVAAPVPTFTQGLPLLAGRGNTPTFTLGGSSAFKLRSYSFDFGNKVEPRFLINDTSIIIPERAEMLEMTIEAEPMALMNPYQLAAASTSQAVVIQHGVAAGQRATINVPLAQIQRPSEIAQNQNVVEWPLRFVPLANAGNDQFTLVLT